MTRVQTAKGSLYFELFGASFLLIELLCYNTSACFVYDTLGKLQDSIFKKKAIIRCYAVISVKESLLSQKVVDTLLR